LGLGYPEEGIGRAGRQVIDIAKTKGQKKKKKTTDTRKSKCQCVHVVRAIKEKKPTKQQPIHGRIPVRPSHPDERVSGRSTLVRTHILISYTSALMPMFETGKEMFLQMSSTTHISVDLSHKFPPQRKPGQVSRKEKPKDWVRFFLNYKSFKISFSLK
jgi:hypothetical protein